MKALLGTGRCVVDVGCGSGEFLNHLGEQFEERIGLDISTRRLATSNLPISNTGFSFREADLNQRFPLGDKSVDAVVANQVIEHILSPRHFACEIFRILRSKGRCVITTPNIRYLKNISALVLSGYGPRTAGGATIDGDWDDGHLHYFTHRDLRSIFMDAGFRVCESRAFISLSDASPVRHLMDRYASNWVVREFLSGNALLYAEK